METAQGENKNKNKMEREREKRLPDSKKKPLPLTSVEVVLRAFQSTRVRTLVRSSGLTSMSSWTSSASLGWSGKESDEVLQDLAAHVRKLRVSIFIVEGCTVPTPVYTGLFFKSVLAC